MANICVGQQGCHFIVLEHQYASPLRRHVKTLYRVGLLNKINMAFAAYLLENGLKVGGAFPHFFKPHHGVFVWTVWPKNKWQMPRRVDEHAWNWLRGACVQPPLPSKKSERSTFRIFLRGGAAVHRLTEGLFTWRKEDLSTRKILEGRSTLRWVYMQKFWSMWYPNVECLRRN